MYGVKEPNEIRAPWWPNNIRCMGWKTQMKLRRLDDQIILGVWAERTKSKLRCLDDQIILGVWGERTKWN